ncbi:hypothetical protein LLE59_15210, partial [Xanthomonas campestris]|nr:hypothetical protein [Xanthomonas campestris]MDM7676019.1 hypothetical protein [Xanthomonas campestris pv. campestris]MEA9554243.1 hypothetical protein [Xanthomonas campestris]MEB1135503.1 hypothetical protein [Xanthomonas campestris pv. campestris]
QTQHQPAVHPFGLLGTITQKIVNRFLDNRASDHFLNESRAKDKISRKQPTNSLVRCPRRLRDRVAARMPPPSPQGRVHGVSRER